MDQDVGLLGSDREVFARVWSRVSPGAGCPVETAPGELAEVRVEDGPGEGRALQALIDGCLEGAADYAALARRGRRQRETLQQLTRRKTGQARRLSGAYFLLSGVRYWPQREEESRDEGFFLPLRRRFWAEREQADALEALGRATGEDWLGQICLVMAEEARETAHIVRRMTEEG